MAAIDRLAWWYGTALCLCFASTSFYVLVGFLASIFPSSMLQQGQRSLDFRPFGHEVMPLCYGLWSRMVN